MDIDYCIALLPGIVPIILSESELDYRSNLSLWLKYQTCEWGTLFA